MSIGNKDNNDNKDKALRIVEALSGVDTELVERSERGAKPGEKTSVNRGKSVAVIIFTKYLAACAVFIFVCVGGFGLYLTTWRAGSAAPRSAEDSAGAAYAVDHSGKDNAVEEPENAEMTAEVSSEQKTADDMEGSTDGLRSEAEEGSIVGDSASTVNAGPSTEQQKSEQVNDMANNMGTGSAPEQELQQYAEKTDNVEEHIPGVIPEKFVQESCQRSGEEVSYHDMTLRWTDSEGYINVYLTDYYLVMKAIYNLPDYVDYGNITSELVEKNCGESNGKTAFAMNIMFEDGVWAEVTVEADMTSEEIYKMLVSMGTVVID